MPSPSEHLAQLPALDECPEPPLEDQQALNDTRPTWPYSQPVICCAFPDRPFELMLQSECSALGVATFEWPDWEAEHGCVRPSSRQSEDPPVCCFYTDRSYLRNVIQAKHSECISSGNDVFHAVPLTWCVPQCSCVGRRPFHAEG